MWNLLQPKASLTCGHPPVCLSIPVYWTMIGGILLVVANMCLVTSAVAAIGETYPLDPPDTSSPRATLQSFLSNMKEAQRLYQEAQQALLKEEGLYPSQEVSEKYDRALNFLFRAMRCLDLSETPPSLADRVGFEAIVILKTILDRIEVPELPLIPDAEAVKTESISHWQLPHTEYTIAMVQGEQRAGEFLFSPATVERLGDDYERVKHLPYKPGAWEGVYSLYLDLSRLVPEKLIYHIPSWGKTRFLHHPAWKWGVLALLLLLMVSVLVLIYRLDRRPSDNGLTRKPSHHLIFPVSIMITALIMDYLQTGIGFRGDINEGITTILQVLFFLAASWTVFQVLNILTDRVIASPRIKAGSLDAAVIRVMFRIVGFGLAGYVIVDGARSLGIPVVPVLAGLGVGGLALALAAQSTVENFIGGITLFADRPVRVGEMCKFGEKLGIIEEIGLRSTRIRTLDRTLVSVPNAEFSKLQLENYTKRDKIRYHPRIKLQYETTPDQIRHILEEVRKLLSEHPKVLPDPARIRFEEFGTYSLDLNIFAYIGVSDYGEFLKVAEDLNLRIMEIVTKAGSRLAIPTWRAYEEHVENLNDQRTRAAVEMVKK